MRASWWSYDEDGCYYITLCTTNRELLFGKIFQAKMYLSEAGKIVKEEFEKSFDIRAELFCDSFVIMPDHIHALLRIDKSKAKPSSERASQQIAEGITEKPPQIEKKYGVAYRLPRSISSFVAGFKSAATKRINELRKTPEAPVWQDGFHDRLVEDEPAHQRVSRYIRNNPAKWKKNNRDDNP